MEISTSHRLWREGWDQERNRRVFGSSASPVSHGHNYEIWVTVDGAVDEETGMVIDLKELAGVMDLEIGERFDHRDLNDDTPFFADEPATAENFSALIFELLDRALGGERLEKVRLKPTGNYAVEVSR